MGSLLSMSGMRGRALEDSAYCTPEAGLFKWARGCPPLCLQPVGGDEVPVPVAALLDDATLGRVVHVHQPEALAVAEGPLEVVHEAPGVVAAHVGAVLDGPPHLADVAPEVADALVVGG